MNFIKTSFTFLFICSSSFVLNGQTLIGVKVGIDWQRLQNSSCHFNCIPSLGLGIDIKGRSSKLIQVGGSVEYYSTAFNIKDVSPALGQPESENIDYSVDWLRFSIFPELVLGKRFQFTFNISPYLGVRIHSLKNGTMYIYESRQESYRNETGPANDDITKLDVGIKESLGFSFTVVPSMIISVEEVACNGINNLIKKTMSQILPRRQSIGLTLGIAYKIQSKKSKENKQEK